MTSLATVAAPSTASSASASRPLKVAVIGNPNTGKSTLFNALAGLHTRVGNYPGVTVEKKVGRVHWDHRTIDLIDLPGTYSLSPRSLDAGASSTTSSRCLGAGFFFCSRSGIRTSYGDARRSTSCRGVVTSANNCST